MDIKKLTQEVLLKNMTPEQQLAVLESVTASVKEAKAVQKQKIAENVDLVLQALKRIESDMLKRVQDSAKTVEDRVKTIKDGKDGKNGVDGKAGKDGINGKDGKDGRDGRDGLNGKAGERGQDGVGVQDAHIDFDGSLIIKLTNGQELNVGEVVPFDVAEKIKVIGNGGGTSQYVLDALAALQTEIDNFEALPSQTGNAGKFLTTDGTTASWASVVGGLSYKGTWNASTNTPTLTSSSGTNGFYYVVGTAGSTNLDGITDWQIGDWLLFNGSNWQKIDQTNLVTSVNGQTGAVVLSTTNVSEGTNQYYTDARARGAISASGSLSYNSTTGVMSYSTPTTDGVSEGSTNKYYTDARARAAVSAGTGISYDSTTGVITNSSPDQTVALTGAGTTVVTGTYPNFTITSADSTTGTVTSVGGTGTVNGLSLSGTVTSIGNLTLGGTLDLSAPPAIGGTTPAAVTGTVVTGSSVVASNGIVVNSQTISSNYTIASGNNGGSFGPVTVASGVTVTISSGSVWTIV
jgi:hypothetical protein